MFYSVKKLYHEISNPTFEILYYSSRFIYAIPLNTSIAFARDNP